MIAFFIMWDLIWPNFYSIDSIHLSQKKLLKYLKIALFGPYLAKNRDTMGHTQNQVQMFFPEITERDHKLSR